MDKKNLMKSILFLGLLAVLLGGAYFVSSRNVNSGNNVTDNSISYSGPDKDGNNNTDSDSAPAYDFELSDLKGNTVKLSDFKGKIVFVNFWATWCPPCTSEMPEFNEANKVFEENGDAIILAVNLTTGGVRRETEDVVRKFANDNGYTMKILLDKTGRVADKYGIDSIPTTYVIDKNGDIYKSYIGAINKDTLMSVYNKLRE